MCLASSQLCCVWCRNCRKFEICMDTSRPEVNRDANVGSKRVSNDVYFVMCRYQCVVTVSRTIQLHIDDDVQLLLRVFIALVHGVSGAADPGIHSHRVGAEIQATVESENLCRCCRLHCHGSSLWLSNSSEVFTRTFGGKRIARLLDMVVRMSHQLFLTAILHSDRGHQQNHSIDWNPSHKGLDDGQSDDVVPVSIHQFE